MQIQIQTRGFRLSDGLRSHAERRLRFALGTAGDRVQRVVMRLADENGPRGGVDKRCTIRAILSGAPTVVIEQQETDLYVAIDRAVSRAGRGISRRLDRAAAQRRDTAPGAHLSDLAEHHRNDPREEGTFACPAATRTPAR